MAKAATAPVPSRATPSGESIPKSERPLPDGDVTRSVSMSSEPSEEDIRLRAYHRYLERGEQHGQDIDDWVAAEQDLKQRAARRDPDRRIGAIEGDRPTDRQQGNPKGPGVNANGLPSDEIATAQDAVGARVDQSQG